MFMWIIHKKLTPAITYNAQVYEHFPIINIQ